MATLALLGISGAMLHHMIIKPPGIPKLSNIGNPLIIIVVATMPLLICFMFVFGVNSSPMKATCLSANQSKDYFTMVTSTLLTAKR